LYKHNLRSLQTGRVLKIEKRRQDYVLRWKDRTDIANLEQDFLDGKAQILVPSLDVKLFRSRNAPVSVPAPVVGFMHYFDIANNFCSEDTFLDLANA